jgi:hypothetical protein
MASTDDRSAIDQEVNDFMAESGGRMYEASPDDPAAQPQTKKRKGPQDTEVRITSLTAPAALEH